MVEHRELDVVARVSSVLSAADAKEMASAVRMAVAQGAQRVIVDLLDAQDFETPARATLTEMQRALRGLVRTAYVSDRPVFRGLALKIVHDADDEHARATASLSEARKWLESSATRIDGSFARLAARGGAR